MLFSEAAGRIREVPYHTELDKEVAVIHHNRIYWGGMVLILGVSACYHVAR